MDNPEYEALTQRQKTYIDILITAVEGGINYWAQVTKYKWEHPDGGLRADTHAIIVEDIEGEPTHDLTVEVIARGMSRLHKGTCTFGGEPWADEGSRRKWRHAYRDCATDDFDHDSDDGDNIVQAGLFGDVRYG